MYYAWEGSLLSMAEEAIDSGTRLTFEQSTENEALERAYQLCSDITADNSKSFYLSSGLLAREKRRGARALYAFCRITDDIVDEAEDNAKAGVVIDAAAIRQNMQDWRRAALASRPAPVTQSGVAFAWADTRARFNIPYRFAEQLIDGVLMDLEVNRYQTFDDLAEYSYGVASTVGLMSMHIVGFESSAAVPYAIRLGVALQMTNILRDVGEDWRNGRLYLPAEELEAFGLSEADIEAGQVTQRWREFMRFQISRNRQLYKEAAPGIRMLDKDGRFAIAASADLYEAILQDIEKHDYDVFNRRSYVSTLGKLARLPQIWLNSRL